MADLTDEELQRVYCWVDSIQLSRPKRNISRDFADGGTCEWCPRFSLLKRVGLDGVKPHVVHVNVGSTRGYSE